MVSLDLEAKIRARVKRGARKLDTTEEGWHIAVFMEAYSLRESLSVLRVLYSGMPLLGILALGFWDVKRQCVMRQKLITAGLLLSGETTPEHETNIILDAWRHEAATRMKQQGLA